MTRRRVLTGITTSGTPHLGNYVGAIRPAVLASREAEVDAYLFLADYHALIKCHDPAVVAQSSLEIAATWLASGLDAEQAHFYRQSENIMIKGMGFRQSSIETFDDNNKTNTIFLSV